ncbi:TSUP family transporter [Bartonella sp. DGB1]|uniref:TSUP family transporter n=1 Tax=Bartonella sp. DGB1 TaxID=3239807 RepID=UPI003523ABED
MEYEIFLYFLLCIVALIAGFTDTLAGGGGLITLPALMLTGLNPVAALGTNKLQSAVAELSAILSFRKNKDINYKLLIKAIIWTIVGATIGTILLQLVYIRILEIIIPFLLTAVFIYYLFTKKLQTNNVNNKLEPDNKKFFLLGNTIGFYNGFFGPATGSIWAIALMKNFSLNLRTATMYAKPLNLAGNLSALSIFIVGGNIDYIAAILMCIGSFIGGKLGAKFILYKDSQYIKIAFISIMLLSIVALYAKNIFRLI